MLLTWGWWVEIGEGQLMDKLFFSWVDRWVMSKSTRINARTLVGDKFLLPRIVLTQDSYLIY